MTFNSSFAVLLAMLALGAAFVTQAAGRPWGSWLANNTTIQNIQEEGEEEGRMTIPSFLLNHRSPLDAERTRQYAALWENHTLGQHIEAFCRNANLLCHSNITVDDPRMDISRDELDDVQLFQDNGEPYVDGQALQLGERDFMEGQDIVLPENLHDLSNQSPAFLPDFLAKKMPLSSEKIQELLDTFHILHDSKLANMMFRTINHCEVVKKKTSKEIEVTKEIEIKEKEVVLSKERELEGKEIKHRVKERKEKEIEFNEEKEVKVKKNKVLVEQKKERDFILNKEKEIERIKEQSITKEVKMKSTEKGEKKEVKKETVQSKEKKTKEKQVKKKEVEQSKVKEIKGKESRKKEIEKFNEKDIKEKKFKEIVHESTKENSSEEEKVKAKEVEYKKKEVKQKEKEIKEKEIHESEEKSFHIREEKEREDKKVKEKEIEHKKEMDLKKKEIHRSEEKSREGKMVKERETIYKKEKESKEAFHITEEKVLEDRKVKKKETKKSREERKFKEEETKYYKEKEFKDKEKEVEKSKEMELKKKDVHGSEEKSKALKEKEIEYEKEKERKEKDTYARKEESTKEISKCVTSLEGMTSFVKKSLPKEKHIKAFQRSTSMKRVEKEQKKIKWKVLALRKYEKAVVCKSNVFLFAVYKCHDISKIGNKFIYHIELKGAGGVYRKEILACEGKKESLDSENRKAKTSTSTMKVSCQWVKSDSLVWASDI